MNIKNPLKKKNKKITYPTKTTLNLLIREKKGMPLRTMLPLLVLMIVVVGGFCWYGIIGRLVSAYRAECAAAEADQALAEARKELLEYDEVEAEYTRYFSDALRSDDMPQECEDVLDMVEEIIMPRATVTGLSFSQNTLLVQLNVNSLDVGARIMADLYDVPMVDTATITTASDAEEGEETQDASADVSTLIMTITLQEVEE